MNLHSGIAVLMIPAAILFSRCGDSGVPPIEVPDTTSHAFVWSVQSLGDGASSVLYDAAVINENLAYAVGAIYLRDSLGNWDPDAYNCVMWDGSTWQLKRIPFSSACTPVRYPPIRAMGPMPQGNILVTSGGSFVTYDGVNAITDCRMNPMLAGAINKMYAVSAEDVYVVGNSGSIIRYYGGSWQSIPSVTPLNILDIWGGYN
jgi:hypothetical protein